MDATFLAVLLAIEAEADSLLHEGERLTAACDGSIFPCDALAIAILHRALMLNRGFVALMRDGNEIAAIPLTRMQLDNVLRFRGVVSCRDPHDIANAVAGGMSFRKIKGGNNQLMNDAELVKNLADPWMKPIYDNANNFVHLTGQHMEHIIGLSDQRPDGTRELYVGHGVRFVKDEVLTELARHHYLLSIEVGKCVSKWTRDRDEFGVKSELLEKFAHLHR